jgi:hypothetical protein
LGRAPRTRLMILRNKFFSESRINCKFSMMEIITGWFNVTDYSGILVEGQASR